MKVCVFSPGVWMSVECGRTHNSGLVFLSSPFAYWPEWMPSPWRSLCRVVLTILEATLRRSGWGSHQQKRTGWLFRALPVYRVHLPWWALGRNRLWDVPAGSGDCGPDQRTRPCSSKQGHSLARPSHLLQPAASPAFGHEPVLTLRMCVHLDPEDPMEEGRLFFKTFSLYWSIVNLQCRVCFPVHPQGSVSGKELPFKGFFSNRFVRVWSPVPYAVH